MDFVPFEIAKKLKEKGFSCEMPFAMYNEIAAFHLLTTSAPYNVCNSGFKCREYYDCEDFDEHDYVAPTISQVLKWLRDKKIHLVVDIEPKGYFFIVNYNITTDFNDKYEFDIHNSWGCYYDYKQAALAGIKYVIDNLI